MFIYSDLHPFSGFPHMNIAEHVEQSKEKITLVDDERRYYIRINAPGQH